MKEECPDKTLLNDFENGWTKHPVGHSRMGKCNCKDESKPDEEGAEKGENPLKMLKCRNAEFRKSDLILNLDCLGMCMNITDTGATQAWAVSFFFLNLVLAITIAILFMSNTGPGIIKN